MKPDVSNSSQSSPYYRHAARLPLASRVSRRVREQVFELFMRRMIPTRDTKVLDIGVTSDIQYRESNTFEKLYPHKDKLVCAGIEDARHLEKEFPGVAFRRLEPSRPLPFEDNEFDLVFSNAVVEHAGDAHRQRTFILEACRVGKRVFIATPNRWFPVEHHTGVPFLHYFPKLLYRRMIGLTALKYWSHEENLNLLTERELAALFPRYCPIRVEQVGVGFSPFKSNLVAYSADPA